MSGTLPQTPAFSELTVTSVQPSFISRSISGRRQARQTHGQYFKLTAKYPPMTRAQFAPIYAFIMKQRGQYESFQVIPPVINEGQVATQLSQSDAETLNGYWEGNETRTDVDITYSTSGSGTGVKFSYSTAPNTNPVLTITAIPTAGSGYEVNDTIIIKDNGFTTNRATVTVKTIDGSGGVTEYLRIDGSAGHTVANKEINFGDGIEATFGASNDLVIKHNGTDTYIENLTGDYYIKQRAADKDLIFQADDGTGGYNAETYFFLDGSASSGNPVTIFPDLSGLYFGSGADCMLRHDGTDMTFENNAGDLIISCATNDKDVILKSDDGSGGTTAYITLDGSETEIHLHKPVGIGTTNPDTAYKLDVAGKVQVQDVLELDNVLTLNAISTPADPAAGKSSIYMDSADGGIKVKINVGGTVVTRTIASYE